MLPKNPVFFITGASSGFGLEIAKLCLMNDYKVVATSRNPDSIPIDDSSNLIKLKIDITNADSIQSVFEEALKKFKNVNILINNAGYCLLGFFEEISSKLAHAQMDINFFGTLNVTRAALPVLRENESSWIVTISSVSGIKGNTANSMYTASKFALEGWMESLSKEVAQWDIKCMIVEPGAFRTPTFDTTKNCVFSDRIIDVYTPQREEILKHYEYLNGRQDGNPEKLAKNLLRALKSENPPFRLFIGKRAWKNLKEYYENRYKEFLDIKEMSLDSDYD